MSLEFAMFARTHMQDGTPNLLAMNGEWRDEQLDERYTTVVNVGKESTVRGYLTFRAFPLDAFDFQEKQLGDIRNDKLVVRIEEKVSGVFVICDPMIYPPEKEGGFDAIK